MKKQRSVRTSKTSRSAGKGRVAVTGGSGKAGQFVVRELLEHGYDVLNVDVAVPAGSAGAFLHADLTNYGEAVDALGGCQSVVHLAAIPAPGRRPAEATFRENILSTFNVFQAAQLHRMKRVVWASSETVLGLPFVDPEPSYAPVDESHPDLPNSTYSLSKVAGEALAPQFSRWTGIPFVGLRFSNVMRPEDYVRFASWQDDAHVRKWNLWGYIDGRDAAQSCRRGLEADVSGADVFIIAAADTVMRRDSASLMKEVFPEVRMRRRIRGRETLLAIDKARRVLGFTPQHSWMTVLA